MDESWRDTVKPIDNLGQTCYANSAIQVIERLWKHKIASYNGRDPLILALKEILTRPGRRNASPLLRLPELPEEYCNYNMQQSSAELMAALLQFVPEDFRQEVRHRQTPTYECETCKKVSTGQELLTTVMAVDGKESQYATFQEYVESYLYQTIKKTCDECRARRPEENWYEANHQERWAIDLPQNCKYLTIELGLFERTGERTVRRNRRIGVPPQEMELFGKILQNLLENFFLFRRAIKASSSGTAPGKFAIRRALHGIYRKRTSLVEM